MTSRRFLVRIKHARFSLTVPLTALSNYSQVPFCLQVDSTVYFIGFIIQPGVLKVHPEKIKAVVEWPIPSNRKELLRFLVFANFFQHFIKDFSKVAAPLTHLTSTKWSFIWPTEAVCIFAFKGSVLVSPNFDTARPDETIHH